MGHYLQRLAILYVAACVLGCGGRREPATESANWVETSDPSTVPGQDGVSSVGTGGEATMPSGTDPAAEAPLQRRIIYTADVELVVEQFDAVPQKVQELAERFGGYVAKSYLTGSPGYRRRGEWTLRIPVENYERCLAAARGLGEVRSVRSDSQDVSEEYYDVEARIRNKKEEEERLRRHLVDSTAKLEDILNVEREISRVREEIERLEGRIRVLRDLTAYSTVRLRVDEIGDYIPEEAPTYGTRVRRAWRKSLSLMTESAQALSIVVVAVAPWLAVIAVAGLLVLLVLRRVWRWLTRR